LLSLLTFVALVVAAIIWYGWLSTSGSGNYIEPATEATNLVLGKTVYMNNCAACHGAQLQGQPHWRERGANGRLPAPPHDPSGHTWHHPDTVLLDIIKNGLVPGRTAPEGYVSDMPAYASRLTKEEIVAVLAFIKSSWPPQVQQAQKQVTLQSGK
jgi:mono/diheme cytochrome c family protein